MYDKISSEVFVATVCYCFTWRNKGRGGWVQSRLDMFLVSEDLHYYNIKSQIHPSIKSDHSLIHIRFNNIKQWSRGSGFYKLNIKLYENIEYVEKNECQTI